MIQLSNLLYDIIHFYLPNYNDINLELCDKYKEEIKGRLGVDELSKYDIEHAELLAHRDICNILTEIAIKEYFSKKNTNNYQNITS